VAVAAINVETTTITDFVGPAVASEFSSSDELLASAGLISSVRAPEAKGAVKSIQTTRRFEIEAVNIIAAASALIAVMFAIGMVMGKVEINSVTISIVTFAGAAPAIGAIVRAMGKRGRG
jgi:hypothetical protein